MKLYLSLFLFFLANSCLTQDKAAVKFSEFINTNDLKIHLEKFASDIYEGREAGRTGQRLAGTYLANMFEAYGVEKYNDSSYFQRFSFIEKSIKDAEIEINGEPLVFKNDFFVIPRYDVPKKHFFSKPKNIALNVFLGQNDSLLRKKDLVINIKNSNAESPIKQIRQVLRHGLRSGVNTIIAVIDSFDLINTDLDKELSHTKNELSTDQKNTNPQLALILNTKSHNKLISLFEGKTDLVATFNAKWHERLYYTENVIGVIKGNEYANEYIAISAHYDHMGIEGNDIYNGADDDGSGTIAILLMAKALAQAKASGISFDKNFVFIGMSAEEKGLLGSKYYTNNPAIPLNRTCANLNIDMIGRRDTLKHETGQYLYIIGSDMINKELHDANEKANSLYSNLELDYRFNTKDDPNQFYYRSDHYNFAKNEIPVIFYFRGVHKDYHKPTDTVDKIEWDNYCKISKHIYFTAWTIGMSPKVLPLD